MEHSEKRSSYSYILTVHITQYLVHSTQPIVEYHIKRVVRGINFLYLKLNWLYMKKEMLRKIYTQYSKPKFKEA